MIKSLLTGVNGWNDTTGVVAEADIVFGTDWWNGYGDYQIHVTDPRVDGGEPASNDWRRFHTFAYADIHVFVRSLSESRPDALFQIERELNRIIGQNVQGITGTSYLRWAPGGGLAEVPEEDSQSNVWHLKGTVMLYWHQVNSS